jgi:chromosome segregation ATPase
MKRWPPVEHSCSVEVENLRMELLKSREARAFHDLRWENARLRGDRERLEAQVVAVKASEDRMRRRLSSARTLAAELELEIEALSRMLSEATAELERKRAG